MKALGLEFEVKVPEPGAEPQCLHTREALSCLDNEGTDVREDGSGYEEQVRSFCDESANVCLRLQNAEQAGALMTSIAEARLSALAKAENAAERIMREGGGESPAICLGADTVVVHDRAVLGKPRSDGDALAMLKELSGKWHHVVTGTAAVSLPEMRSLSSCAVTAVKFRTLAEEDILAYIRTGHPMDKAGAYGIQELGSLFVERVDGCYFNVVGLPVTVINGMLGRLGWDILKLRKSKA